MTTPSSTQPRFAPSWVINISVPGSREGQRVARPSQERHLELKRPDAGDDQPTEHDPLTAEATRTTGLLQLSPAGDPAELVFHIAGNSVDDVEPPARSFLREVPPDILYQVAKFLPLADLARLFPTLRIADAVKSAAGKMMRSVGDIGVLHEARDALSERWERLAFHHQQLAHPPERVTAALVMVFCCACRSASQRQKQITHTLAALDETKVEMANLQQKTRDAVFLFGAHRLNAGDEDRAFYEGVTAFVSGIVSSPNLTARTKERICLWSPDAGFIETALANHNYPAAVSILLGIVQSAAPMRDKIWLMASAQESWPGVNTAAAAFEAACPEWGAELSQRLNTAMAWFPPSLRYQGC